MAFCPVGQLCLQNIQYVGQTTPFSPEIITNLQLQFNARVMSVQSSYDGNTQVQLMTQDSRIMIVTVNPYGAIIGVQE